MIILEQWLRRSETPPRIFRISVFVLRRCGHRSKFPSTTLALLRETVRASIRFAFALRCASRGDCSRRPSRSSMECSVSFSALLCPFCPLFIDFGAFPACWSLIFRFSLQQLKLSVLRILTYWNWCYSGIVILHFVVIVFAFVFLFFLI